MSDHERGSAAPVGEAASALGDAEARELAMRLELAFDHLGIGTWWLTPTGEARIDEQERALLGLPAGRHTLDLDEFLGRVHEDDREDVTRQVRSLLVEGAQDQCDFRYRRPDGALRWLRSHGAAVRDGAGRVTRVVGINYDDTERKQAEESLRDLALTLEERVRERTAELERQSLELRRLARQLSAAELAERQRVATLLHDDLQQLLVAAKMRATQAVAPTVPAPRRAEHERALGEYLDAAIAASRRLASELCPPALDEGGLAEALEWLCDQFAALHQLTVERSCDPDATPDEPEVRGFLFWAARSLLLNVVKHSGVDRASLRLEREGPDVRLTVADEGVGCDAQVVQTRPARGAPFGLRHVRQRVALLGGRVELQAAPGGGCRVSLLLPRRLLPPG